MSKKEIILNNKPIAYYSGLNGIEIYFIEYGINDYIYFTSNSWSGTPRKKQHKTRIYYTNKETYFKCNGYKIPLDECIRI